MELQEFVELMERISATETTTSERAEIVTNLIDDYTNQTSLLTTLQETTTTQENEIADLTKSNSILFRKFGASLTTSNQQHQEEERTGANITLEDIEGGY